VVYNSSRNWDSNVDRSACGTPDDVLAAFTRLLLLHLLLDPPL